ncbi:unnamed protein product, partial [Allacma fusca]
GVLISRVGDRNVKEGTENLLGHLMTNTVAVEYNWTGTKGDHSLVGLSEIEDPVKVWLKNASARIKRSKNSSVDTADEMLNE